MIRAKEARKEAREALNGKWKTAIIVSLIYSLIVFGIGFISSFLGVLGLIISIANIVIAPPLTYGIAYVYYHLKNGESVGYADFLTVGFKNFGRSWGIAREIFCKCWYLIVIPIVIIMIVVGTSIAIGISTTKNLQLEIPEIESQSNDYSYYDKDIYNNTDNNYPMEAIIMAILVGGIVNIYSVIIFIILIIVIVLLIRKLLLYALSYYIAVENENMMPKQAVNESKNLMKGNRGKLFILILSFFGWSILVNLLNIILAFIPVIGVILGVGVLIIGTSILTPYITFAILSFYKDLKNIEKY